MGNVTYIWDEFDRNSFDALLGIETVQSWVSDRASYYRNSFDALLGIETNN